MAAVATGRVGFRVRPARAVSRTPVTSALLAGLAGGLVLVGVTAPFMGRYGWMSDELYFLAASHHLALGYVDFQPLIAIVARLVGLVAPKSLIALRITSLAEGAATVVLVALTVRELGGGRRAQWIGSLAWALTPYILSSASTFHATWLDALASVGFLYSATRLLVRGESRMWVALGIIAGVGLEAKYTIAFLVFGFVAALVLSGERRRLRTAWPLVGLAIALALLIPNLIWQVEHGWPSLQFASSLNTDTSRPADLAQHVLYLGAVSLLAASGIVWLWRHGPRPLALVPVMVTLLCLLGKGRAYYPLPADAVAVAAGAIAVDQWLRGVWRLTAASALVALQVAVIVFLAPYLVPFYSTAHLVRSNIWKTGFYKDELGWPELTSQVERVWARLSLAERAGGVILTENYGEASALAFYGHALGPVVSGHLSWQYWRPRHLPQRFALVVGYPASRLQHLCTRWRPLARIDNPWHIDNGERRRLIVACDLGQPIGSIWTRQIATDQF